MMTINPKATRRTSLITSPNAKTNPPPTAGAYFAINPHTPFSVPRQPAGCGAA